MIKLVLGIIANNDDIAIDWGRTARAHVTLLLLVAASYCLVHNFVCNV
jgi:hypothetical protein